MTEVVSAIIRKDNKILICQRVVDGNTAFLWEFPGGKREKGETLEDCLIRECKEELSIDIEVLSRFATSEYEYPDQKIAFTFFNANIIRGEISTLVHNEIKFVSIEEIKDYDFCPADTEVINNLYFKITDKEDILIAEEDFTQEKAKDAFASEDYALAEIIYRELWNKNKSNNFLLNHYGKCLRKNNKSVIFVDICRDLIQSGKILNDYINSTLCWCLYDSRIKNYIYDGTEGFENFLLSAKYICEHCMQEPEDRYYYNPYVLTVVKVVKAYSSRSSVNYKGIIIWLRLLNPDNLSEKPFEYTDNEGVEREQASPKEFYYQHMAKSLEKTNQYEECIEICQKSFEQIKKFHYRNHIWIKARWYFSKCMTDDVEKAISDYKNLAQKENAWFMFHKLSQICLRYNKPEDALLYASKAFVSKYEYEKMVNLMYDTGLLWLYNSNKKNAEKFLQAAGHYREKQGWFIPQELKYYIKDLEIDLSTKPNKNELVNISKGFVDFIEPESKKIKGIVKTIFSHGKSGFIAREDNNTDVYFNSREAKGFKIAELDKVKFDISIDKNNKMYAINIEKEKK